MKLKYFLEILNMNNSNITINWNKIDVIDFILHVSSISWSFRWKLQLKLQLGKYELDMGRSYSLWK